MRVLLTNRAMNGRTGTELYVRDVALSLYRRGHRPVVYSPCLGPVGAELRHSGVPVVDQLSSLAEPPDVIHGQHHLPTMAALSAFPGVPAIFVCHGWRPWDEAPPLHPRIVRYVAVGEASRERLVAECGIAPTRVDVLFNFVDLERFRLRDSLPPRPARALLLSNYVTPDSPYLRVAREACARTNLDLVVAGTGMGNATDKPERLMAAADLALAQGRTALEALAAGCAVVIASSRATGPLVTTGNYGALRPLNFGLRAQTYPLTVGALVEAISAYNAADAARVSGLARAEAGLEPAVERLLLLYDVARSQSPSPAGRNEEGMATAAYLRTLAVRVDGYDAALAERDRLGALCEDLRRERDGLCSALNAHQRTLSWRLRERLVRWPGIRTLERWVRHRQEGRRRDGDRP